MKLKTLIFELVRENEMYFPGVKGSRIQVEINLKKFIFHPAMGKRLLLEKRANEEKKKKS